MTIGRASVAVRFSSAMSEVDRMRRKRMGRMVLTGPNLGWDGEVGDTKKRGTR
jgi:hypothetical protein